MKVLKISDVPLAVTGGINIFMRKTGDALVSRGGQVDYLFREDLAPRAMPRLLGRRLFVPWLISWKVLWRHLRGRTYDVVEIHEYVAAGYCLLCRLRPLRLPPCVVISYGTAERQWQAKLERWRTRGRRAPLKSLVLVPTTLLPQSRYAFVHAQHVLVSSEEDGRYVHALGVPWDQIGRTDSGVGQEYFELERSQRVSGLRLLFIGTWIDRKGVPELTEAWHGFAARHPAATLTVACTVKEEDQVLSSFSAHRERVTVKPRLSEAELKAELTRHDVFVLPAWFEGGAPLAVLQAAAAGLACVVTEIGGYTDVFDTGDPEAGGALMIKPHDGAALITAFERLASEPGLLERLAKNARHHARNFTWDRQVDHQLAGYRAAISRHRAMAPEATSVEPTS